MTSRYVDPFPLSGGAIFTPQPPKPPTPPENPMTATPDQIAEFIGQLNDPILLGARQRYRDEVLLPRDRVSAAKDDNGDVANHADMMTGGAAMFFDRSYVRDYLIARIKGADVMTASVDGLMGAADAYRRAVGVVAPSQPTPAGRVVGPISVSGRDFEVPQS